MHVNWLMTPLQLTEFKTKMKILAQTKTLNKTHQVFTAI